MSESDTKIQHVELGEIPKQPAGASVVVDDKLELVKDVKVQLSVRLGNTEVTVGELFDLKQNHVLKLDSSTSEPIDLLLDEKVVARGNLVVVDENFGVEITEVLDV